MHHLFCSGGKQKIDGNIKELLSLSEFKNDLLRFLNAEFQKEQYYPLFNTKVVYFAIDNDYLCIGRVARSRKVTDLHGKQQKKGSRVMLHAKQADDHNCNTIVIWANDTDILLVRLTNVTSIKNSCLWLDSGKSRNNTRAFLNISELSKKIPFRESLAGLYGFIGNDYTLHFLERGKDN